MRMTLLALCFSFLSFTSFGQKDSLSVDAFVNMPVLEQNFSLSKQIGLKFGKKSSTHKYSVSYGRFKTESQLLEYLDIYTNTWTRSVLILNGHSDSLPGRARAGKVSTTTNSLTIGWSNTSSYPLFSLYGGISFTSFFNRIHIDEAYSDAYISNVYPNEFSTEEEREDIRVFYPNTDVKINGTVKSIVPAINFESGMVFKSGNNLTLIPMLNFGFYITDSRVNYGTFYPVRNNIAGDLNIAIKLSYSIL